MRRGRIDDVRLRHLRALLSPLMDMLVAAMKRRLHREIVADPVLHGRVLNLYLNGERYPERVQDYFPLALVEDGALEARMRRHLREEEKHVALYVRAIAKLGEPVRELPREDIYNSVILRHSPPMDGPRQGGRDARTLRLAHFLAHLHFLEARIGRSLEYHGEACLRARSDYAAKAVSAVLADEYGHVIYTREAVQALLPQRMAPRVLAAHRRAESRANREFSATELRRLLREHGTRFPRASRVFYGACTALVSPEAAHG
jgi:hypothetical protein